MRHRTAVFRKLRDSGGETQEFGAEHGEASRSGRGKRERNTIR
jgi:hypothetical protein